MAGNDGEVVVLPHKEKKNGAVVVSIKKREKNGEVVGDWNILN